MQSEPIESDRLLEQVRTDADGAVALFVGTVRNHNLGRRVERLLYEAYVDMAESEMAAIEREARERFEIGKAALVHRTGELRIGEAAVAVAVAAHHRDAAIDACRFCIDTLKRRVPIWKKEFFDGGEDWVPGCSDPSGTS